MVKDDLKLLKDVLQKFEKLSNELTNCSDASLANFNRSLFNLFKSLSNVDNI